MLRMTELKKDDTRNILSDIKLFEGLTPAQLDWVAHRAHRRVFPNGKNVMLIEQPGEAVYIILHGTVKVYTEQGGRDAILSILGGGGCHRRDESDRQCGALCQRGDARRLAHVVDGQDRLLLHAG